MILRLRGKIERSEKNKWTLGWFESIRLVKITDELVGNVVRKSEMMRPLTLFCCCQTRYSAKPFNDVLSIMKNKGVESSKFIDV